MADRLRLNEFLGILEGIAPFALAEAWDNVGLMVGNPGQEVSGLLVALDPDETVLTEAMDCGANTVVTHHPLIFHPLRAVRIDQAQGRFLKFAIENNIAVVSCHTNLDVAPGGVNDVLAAAIGLEDIKPIIPSRNDAYGIVRAEDDDEASGSAAGFFGRYGRLPVPVNGVDFLKQLASALAVPVLATAGTLPEEVSTVAVCGGSGSDLAESAFSLGAQIFITGEVKHATARWAEASGFCVIDAGHFATENPVVKVLADRLQKVFAERGLEIDVHTSQKQGNPFVFHQFAN